MRLVLDTNVLASAAIRPNGEAGRVLNHVRHGRATLLYSTATLEELVDVLNRPHLRRKYHLTEHYLHYFLHLIRLHGEKVTPTEPITACRDADDNKFLEVAVSAAADYLVSKDDDLLILSPFAGIPIITPADFLEKLDYGTTDE